MPTASTTGSDCPPRRRSSVHSRRAGLSGSSFSAYSAPSYSTKRTTWRLIPRIRLTRRGESHSSSGDSQGRSRKLGWPVRATSWNLRGKLLPRDRGVVEGADAARARDDRVVADLRMRVVVRLDRDARAGQVAARIPAG